MIKLNNVSFKYSEEATPVVKQLSLTIHEGEWVSLVGHNGSGKSTVAKLMNGLLLPAEGTILIDNMELNESTIWEARKKIGMVFQNPENQFVGTTVMDDVVFGLENLGIKKDEMEKRMIDSLKLVGMLDYKLHEPHRLSGGQKQRVAIAGVLAIMPDVIIFDEASTMLDPNGKKELIQTIKQLRKERDLTMITITHDLNEVAHTDRVVALNEGEKWFDGSPRELFKKYDELSEIGLLPPFTTELARVLKANQIHLTEEPLNYKELVDQLWTLYLKT